MKRPGYVRGSLILAGKDLRLEWRTLETLSSTAIFSLAVLVVFSFAFGAGAIRQLGADRLVPGVIWTTLTFASVVAMARSIQLERTNDALSALFLAPVDRGALYTGKLLANLVKLTVLQAILLPLTAVLFDYDLIGIALPLLLVVFVHGLGLTELGTMFAAISSRLGRGEALLATLLFPAVSPLLIRRRHALAAGRHRVRRALLLRGPADFRVRARGVSRAVGVSMKKTLDPWLLALWAVTTVAMPFALWMVMLYAPEERVMGAAQKIFYFHVASAITMYAAVAVLLAGGVAYLWTRDLRWDNLSRAANEAGLVFCGIVLISGPIWAKPAWGTWWTWEARLTTTLVLWLLLAGALMVRSYAESRELGARLAAVVGVIAALDVYIVKKAVEADSTRKCSRKAAWPSRCARPSASPC
jgi:heme exporter protein CcmB